MATNVVTIGSKAPLTDAADGDAGDFGLAPAVIDRHELHQPAAHIDRHRRSGAGHLVEVTVVTRG